MCDQCEDLQLTSNGYECFNENCPGKGLAHKPEPNDTLRKRIELLEKALLIAVEGLSVIKTFDGKAAVRARQTLFILESLNKD